MGFLDRAIKNGISKGISQGVSNAIGNVVKQVVEPKAAEYANSVAKQLDDATASTAQQTHEVKETIKNTGGLEGAFANLQQSMENYATEMSKNVKICPECETPSTADKIFCPNCGAKLPEYTVAESAICPECGKQNTIGTKFCQDCGAKLPLAIEEEKKNASVLEKWNDVLAQYPVWSCGGTEFCLENNGGYVSFIARMESDFAAQNAVNKYRESLLENGFRQAGEYPCREHLYKKIDGVCYHVDTEHCFDGDSDAPSIYFDIAEPVGGFDYVKPEPKKSFGLKDIFKL